MDREKTLSRHETVEKKHGRLEQRILEATTILQGYLDKWPRVRQVFRILRHRDASEEIAYGITSLPPEQADAQRLLRISREHWAIENSLHYIRDVTFLEDRCRTRNRNKAQILAAFRNMAITLIKQTHFKCVPEGIEYYAHYRDSAIAIIMKNRTE